MSVLTVGCCLRQTLIWKIILVFTLVQSRTHADTVQNVFRVVINSRYICWSHTMKVLGWRVAFVRRSSAAVVALRIIYVDMEVWSRMFAVNVQSVSVQPMNWEIISCHIRTTNSSAVVCVTKVSDVDILLKSTLRDVLMSSDLVIINLQVCVYVCGYWCTLVLVNSDVWWTLCMDFVSVNVQSVAIPYSTWTEVSSACSLRLQTVLLWFVW